MWATRICGLPTNHIKVCVHISLLQKLHTSGALGAGHSKWANIRHIKALKDGQKSAAFTRYSRQIRIAIQDGGSANPNMNPLLRNVIEDALRKNMPMATIQNSIKKSTQSKSLLKKHFLYWKFQQRVFSVCSLYTDNLPQLKMELAPTLRKSGAVYVDCQHIFDDVGIIEAVASDTIKSNVKTLDELKQICTDDAIECGIEEVEVVDHVEGKVDFKCNPIELTGICRALKTKGYMIESAEHVFIPKTTVKLTEDDLEAYEKFLKKVRDLPGIEEIYDNVEVATTQI